VSADLIEQLKSSLASTYTIERELGGGGMSRVFLAQDLALGRSVVIKVLLPELAAGVNAERFKREVQLSARLQHPHIVPVLTAGEVDGLPYYVMPFVKGESLRARLVSGPMPVPEIVSSLADVAKALAYAHSEGIVHRDIKPDNILLSGGASTVADFGIAKAISSARQTESGETLTTLGTSLGTPAYMAPEQVAGDPNVDHRADIYSLGCVAYEMLTGHSPFAGKSPQQMLAAQVMERPRPVTEARPDIPPTLALLVTRCLEKEPSARPQSASELASQLETTGSHTAELPAARRGSRVATWALLTGIIVLAGAAALGYRTLRHMTPTPTGSVLEVAVAPFEVFDPQLALWKEGIVDVLSRNLDGSGPIRAVPPSAAIKKWDGHGDRTTATTFGKRVGAQIVVYGQIQTAGRDAIDAKAWVVDASRDAQPIQVEVHDSTARMDRVTDSLSVKLLAAIGRDHPIGAAKIASMGSGSLPAIKAFLQGSQYFRRTQWDSAAAAFKEAVTLDSTFGIAYLHLSQTLGWSKGTGNAEGIAANARAGQLVRPGLSPHDSLMMTAAGHYARAGFNGSNRNPVELHAAIAALRAATDQYPNDPEAWYWLGDMRYHNDNTLSEREALRLFDHSIEADSDFAPAYIHAIELAYRNGSEVGRRYAESYLKRDPRDFDGEGIRFAAMITDPRTKTADIERVLDTITPRVGQKAFTAIQRTPDSAEVAARILRAAVRRMPPERTRSFAGLLATQLAMHGHVDSAWKLAVASKSLVAGEIAGLGLVPADSAAKVLKPWLNEHSDASLAPYPALAMAHDTATLLATAAGLEKFLASSKSTENRPAQLYVLAALRAYAALAKGDTAAATKLFDAIPDSVIALPMDQFIRARLVARADPKRALDILERHTPITGIVFAARELERGRLAEKLGDRERAVDAYSFVAEMWQNADAKPLRDAVKEANDALKRLDSDGRVRAQLAGAPKS
jgi:serine/threonine-protein kinase